MNQRWHYIALFLAGWIGPCCWIACLMAAWDEPYWFDRYVQNAVQFALTSCFCTAIPLLIFLSLIHTYFEPDSSWGVLMKKRVFFVGMVTSLTFLLHAPLLFFGQLSKPGIEVSSGVPEFAYDPVFRFGGSAAGFFLLYGLVIAVGIALHRRFPGPNVIEQPSFFDTAS